MDPIFVIVGAALFAWLNHYLATQRGRNPIGWAIAGAAFGLFSTALLLILGETEEHRIEIMAKANNTAPKQ